MDASCELEVMKRALLDASRLVSDRSVRTKPNPQGAYDAVTPSDLQAEEAILAGIRL